MSEEKKLEILNRIRDALAEVPEQYQESVCRELTHDIGVIKRTIGMVTKQAG